jgi:hypothetical protein
VQPVVQLVLMASCKPWMQLYRHPQHGLLPAMWVDYCTTDEQQLCVHTHTNTPHVPAHVYTATAVPSSDNVPRLASSMFHKPYRCGAWCCCRLWPSCFRMTSFHCKHPVTTASCMAGCSDRQGRWYQGMLRHVETHRTQVNEDGAEE